VHDLYPSQHRLAFISENRSSAEIQRTPQADEPNSESSLIINPAQCSSETSIGRALHSRTKLDCSYFSTSPVQIITPLSYNGGHIIHAHIALAPMLRSQRDEIVFLIHSGIRIVGSHTRVNGRDESLSSAQLSWTRHY